MLRFASRCLLAASLSVPLTSVCAADNAAPQPTTVELSADARQAAPNDLATATVYFQADDREPGKLARSANSAIAAALEQARAYPAVKAKTAGASTFPVYGREGRRIEGWRIRAELQLESRDISALSELLGKLQDKLALAGLSMQPAPDTRNKAADQAANEAIRAFQARADAIARTLGKSFRIRHLSISHGGGARPIHPVMRATTLAAESSPMTIEAGETEITVTVNGTIELGE